MTIKCLIIDDEPIAQEIIEHYLEPLAQIQVVGKCNDVLEAMQFLQAEFIDLIFLDIEMPHIDGLSFVRSLENPPQVIITTAYREYAIEGFEMNAVDYLLKPISKERFLKAINRILLKSPSVEHQSQAYIYLKVDMKMVQVYLNEILYIQGLSNYVRIFCENRNLISYQKLIHLEEVLNENSFKRCHRSYIVNLKKIKAYTTQELELGINEKISIPISGRYRDSLLKSLERFKK